MTRSQLSAHAQCSAHRAWNTWAADRYLEMSFSRWASASRRSSMPRASARRPLIGPGTDVRLGRHDRRRQPRRGVASPMAARTLDWPYGKASAFDLRRRLEDDQIRRMGPALLGRAGAVARRMARVWHYRRGAHDRPLHRRPAHRGDQGRARAAAGHRRMRRSRICAGEYESNGYWYLASRATAAPAAGAALQSRRGAGEPISSSRSPTALDLAMDKRRATAAHAPACPPRTRPSTPWRDVMGWNTIWDGVNHRPYITCSRNWDLEEIRRLRLLAQRHRDQRAAWFRCSMPIRRARILAMLLSAATPEGNLPCIMTGNDAWVDRTQTPHHLLHRLADLSAHRQPQPARAWPIQSWPRNNAWIARARDGNGNGILEFGSSDVGHGLYQRHQARGEGRILHGQFAHP